MIEGAIDGFSESEVYDDFWSENAPTVQSFETNCIVILTDEILYGQNPVENQ
jgi:hypothetical protein